MSPRLPRVPVTGLATRLAPGLDPRIAPGLVALLVLALVAWSAAQRWHVLAGSPFPLGVDGYFYPVQLRALLDTGALQYPAAPLAFYLLAPFAAATDPITGAKLGAAVLGALVAVPAYGVGARLGGSRGAGLVAAVLATTSAGSAYMTVEFVKNGIGMTVALAAIWAGLRAAEAPTRARIGLAVAAVAAAAATHKMAGAVAAIVLVPAAFAEAVHRGRLRGRRLLYALAAAVALGIAALAVGLLAPQRLLAPADLAQLGGLVGDTARWDLPALVMPRGTIAVGHEAWIGAGLALAVAAALLARRVTRRVLPGSPAERVAAGVLVVLALAIAIPWLAVDDAQGLAFRLRVAAFVPMALLGAVAARALVAAIPRAVHALGPLAIVLALALPRTAARTDGRVITHPALASAALALVGQLPPGAELVVPERHIAFMVAWYTGAPVALQPDAVPRAHRYRLLPLFFIGDGSPLDHALDDARREPGLVPPLGVHARKPNGLVLVAEPTWDWALARLPARDRSYFAAWPVI